MDPILLILETWWWVAPAAAGAGTAAYAGLTVPRRRARRLEVDAAKHEEGKAVRALLAARADVRGAQAEVLAARATSGEQPPTAAFSLSSMLMGAPMVGNAETTAAAQALHRAKLTEKSAAIAVKASRARVKAMLSQYRAASSADPLPIEKVFGAHDAVVVRWMSYETDIAKTIAYPQLSDPANPATVVFLRAQRVAQDLRPRSARERIPPQRFVEYRDAVRVLESAFDEAERQAGAAPPLPTPPRTGLWSAPGWFVARPPSADRPRG